MNRGKSRRKLGSKKRVNWKQRAFKAGYRIGSYYKDLTDDNGHQILNLKWNAWVRRSRFRTVFLKRYVSVAKSFIHGFSVGANWNKLDKLVVPSTKATAAVIAVKDEEQTLSYVLHQLQRLPLHELIIVINGSTDNSYQIAQQVENAKVVYYPMPLGHDVGRAIGARLAESEILLFLDGDILFEAEQLLPFIYSIESNNDVVLNDISPYIGPFKFWDSVTIMKEFMNRVLKRPDLKMNSMTAVPHALTKRAVETIGYENLTVPPVAHALAIHNGLRIGKVSGFDVVTRNKHRDSNVGVWNQVSDLVIGDHLEALSRLMEHYGERLVFIDQVRDRTLTNNRFISSIKHTDNELLET